MTATLEREPTDFWDKWQTTRAPDERPAPVELAGAPPPRRVHSPRPLRAFLRFLITLGIGVGGTLAWQAYGDEARQMMSTAYPQQLGWIAPPAATLAPPSAPAAVAPAVPAAPSLDQQQMNTMSLNLAAVRQTVEQLAAQIASGQQQMSGDIARLQASEQDILNKVSAPPPRPAPAAARKPPAPPVAIAPPTAPTAPAH